MVNHYNRDIHHRRSIRLKGHDYSQAGGYFVTVCTHDRECLFGEIVNGEMRLNEFGRLVRDEWLRSAEIRAAIELGEYVVMPNHFHGIVLLNGRGTARRAPTTMEQFGKPVSDSLPTVVRSLKSAVTKRINAIRQSPGAPVHRYGNAIITNTSSVTMLITAALPNTLPTTRAVGQKIRYIQITSWRSWMMCGWM